MQRRIRLALLPMACLLGLSAADRSAQAGLVSFFGQDFVNGVQATPRPNSNAAQANFLANLTGVGTENFEAFATGATAPLTLTFVGAGTAALTGAGSINDTPNSGAFATSGSKYFFTSNAAGNEFTVTFNANRSAFGFFATDVGDFGTQLSLQLTNAANVMTTINVPHAVGSGGNINGNVFFYGIIAQTAADDFKTIKFTSTTGVTDSFGFDDMTVGAREQVSLVPEPTTLVSAAFAGVVVGLGYLRRRRPSTD